MSAEAYSRRQVQLLKTVDEDYYARIFGLKALHLMLYTISLGDSYDSCKTCTESATLAILREYGDEESTEGTIRKARSDNWFCKEHPKL